MLNPPDAVEAASQSRRRGGWRRRVGAAAVAAALAGMVPTAAAVAKPRPTAHQLRSQLASMNNRAEQITEQYNGKRLELARARAAERRAVRQVSDTKGELTRLRGKIGTAAAAQYMSGGANSGVATLFGVGPQQVLDRSATLSHLDHNQAAELRDLVRASGRYTAARNSAHRNTRRVKAVADQISGKKTRIEGLVGQIKGKLAELRRQKRAEKPAPHTPTPAPTHSAPPQQSSPSPSPGRTSPPPAPSPGGNSSKAQRAVQYALSKVGDPYVWGAAGPSTFDCSGLTMWAYQQVGINLPHYTGAQYAQGRHISLSEIRPGDLIFFYSDLHHVGMYIGHGKMVDAPHTGADVRVESFGGRPIGGVARYT